MRLLEYTEWKEVGNTDIGVQLERLFCSTDLFVNCTSGYIVYVVRELIETIWLVIDEPYILCTLGVREIEVTV